VRAGRTIFSASGARISVLVSVGLGDIKRQAAQGADQPQAGNKQVSEMKKA
jgi:hypothetical protein